MRLRIWSLRLTESAAARRVGLACLAAVLILLCCAEGQTEVWVDRRVCGTFVVWAEFPLDDWRPLLDQLAQLQVDLRDYLGIPPPRERIEVYLFRDQSNYAEFVRIHLANIPYRRALYVKGSGPGRIFAYHGPQCATDLRHECTHALLHAVLAVVPLWLDEGLAEYFEVPSVRRAFGHPHLSKVRRELFWGRVPKIEALEAKQSMSEFTQADYRHAWAWVHFMWHGPWQARQELISYFKDIQSCSPPGLLSQRLRRALKEPERLYAAHFRHWNQQASK